MKTKPHLLAILATALSTTTLLAEEPPPSPPTPPAPPTPARETKTFPAPARGDTGNPAPRPQPRAEGSADPSTYQVVPGTDAPSPKRLRTTLAAPSEPQPFLGVVSSEVPAALTAQLGLPPGFGLLVEDVLPESPAAKAGLQKYDVLKTFNDQQLVNPEQLATLVRAAGKGKEVSITLLRKGQEQKLAATVSERDMPPPQRAAGELGKALRFQYIHPDGTVVNGMREAARDGKAPESWGDDVRVWNDRIKGQAEALAEKAREQARSIQRSAEGIRDRVQKEVRRAEAAAAVPPVTVQRDARPERDGEVSVYSSNGVTTLNSAKAHLMLKDNDGEIDVQVDDGHRTLTAKNARGEVVFSGPIDTEEQRKAVPEEFRKKLEQVKIEQNKDPEKRER